MSRIVMLTVGSRGDVQPVVALGVELRGRGHRVTVATHDPFRPMVERHGLDFAPLPGDPNEVLRTPAARRLLATGPSVIRVTLRFLAVLRPWFEKLTQAAERACRDADLILYSPLAFVGWHLAEARKKPSALMALQPFEPTSEWSAVPLGGRDLSPVVNRLTHLLARQLAWQPLRAPVQEWRKSIGLPPLSVAGPFRELSFREHPQVLGYSPTVVPRPHDWPEHVHVTGYWFLDPQPAWAPPPDVTDFLARGSPPLYIGFGSMTGTDETAATAAAVAIESGYRVVSHADLPASPETLIVPPLPHDWLLPRMAGAVHHGGAGTTAAVLRAGIPSIVVPLFGDQPFWARRVAALGAGPDPIPFSEAEAGRFATGLAHLGHHRPAARTVAVALARENGTATAANLVDALL